VLPTIGILKQSRSTQQQADGSIDLTERCILNRVTRYQDNIPACRYPTPSNPQPNRFTHPALYPVAVYGLADTPAHGETKAAVLQVIGQYREHQQRMDRGSPLTTDKAEIITRSQTMLLVHSAADSWRQHHEPGVSL
jgi:hypothetical protein